jgi:hypothetical protein
MNEENHVFNRFIIFRVYTIDNVTTLKIKKDDWGMQQAWAEIKLVYNYD